MSRSCCEKKTLLGLTGGPTADFNMCLFDDSPNLAEIVADSVARVRSRGLPALFMLSSEASRSLGGRSAELGLSSVGEAPLMIFSGEIPELTPGYEVVRVTDELGVHEVANMVATAFELDREWVGKTFASKKLAKSSTAFYLARAADRPMSTVTPAVVVGPSGSGRWQRPQISSAAVRARRRSSERWPTADRKVPTPFI